MPLPIRDIPESQRPRERLLRDGPSGLSDGELLALLLGSGSQGSSALETAQAVLSLSGGVSGVAAARPVELSRYPGIGPAKAARVAAAFELTGRMGAPTNETRLASSEAVAALAQPMIGRARVEKVMVMVVDGGHRVVHSEQVAMGHARSCPVPVREVLATVLRHDGVAFALAHNHPSGDPTPTSADEAATETLREAAQQVGLRLLDHVVVTTTDWRSVTASR